MKYLICLAVLIGGCVSAETIARSKKNLDRLEKAAADVVKLKAVYDQLQAEYRAGKLDVADFVSKSSEVTAAISSATIEVQSVKSDIDKQRDDGVGWQELLLGIGIAFFGRGLPSKGPMAFVGNFLKGKKD